MERRQNGIGKCKFLQCHRFFSSGASPRRKYPENERGCAQALAHIPDDWWSTVWLFSYLSVFPFTTPTPVQRSYPDLALWVAQLPDLTSV